jgi:hypothetical protein
VAIAATGGFAPGAAGSIPAPAFAFAGSLALLFGAWFFIADFRAALLSVPLPVLIALHIGRIGGVFFLLLAADGRLPIPFAPSGVGATSSPGLPPSPWRLPFGAPASAVGFR